MKLENKLNRIISSCTTIEQWQSAKRIVENIQDKNAINYYNIILRLGIKYGTILLNK